MTRAIAITRTTAPKTKPDQNDLGFGRFFSDHQGQMEWTAEGGWGAPRVVPYGPIPLDPAAGVLHYGQAMFEGLKAFRQPDGGVKLFRPEAHVQRMIVGAPRLCMPSPPADTMLELLKAFVRTDLDWVPSAPMTSLYLRPTLIATDAFLGVRPANKYLFFVIGSPVGAYYSGGLRPVRIWVERSQTRAAKGGLGAVKAGANYVASLYAANKAKKDGYDQVLWLDSVKHETIEEVGTMNLFVVFGDELVTPPLSDSILAGVTRDSIMALGQDLGLKVSERAITVEELVDGEKSGRLKEVFGSGSAAVVSPVGELAIGDNKIRPGRGEAGPVCQSLYDAITQIQRGTRPDKHGWMMPV